MADVSKHLDKAEKYLQKGKPEAALEEYFAALEKDPHNESVRQQTADLCLTLSMQSDAVRLLNELYEHAVATGDSAKAIVLYKKLNRVGSPTLEQTFRFAQLSEKPSKREALEAYEAAYEGFIRAGRKNEAMESAQRIVALEPTEDNHRRFGELAAVIGDNKTAANAFIAIGILRDREKKDSSEAYERAYKLDPENPAAALGHGRTLAARGEAEEAIRLLHSLANYPSAPAEAREAYGKALLMAKRFADAEPFIWEMFERDPKQYMEDVSGLVGALLDAELDERALKLARKLDEFHRKAGTRRDFVALMKETADSHRPHTPFLEYMVELYNSSNREHDYCDTLLKLFELYFASGNFIKAADALDRAAEVDPYEDGHQKRLERLKGKIEPNLYHTIGNRFAGAVTGASETESPDTASGDNEPTVLEDLVLQAEIFLQYSMRSKAVERLERIAKLFPREEEKNDQLRTLYFNAGFVPSYAEQSAEIAGTPASLPAPPTPVPIAIANENSVDNIAKVTEITRNIYRQPNVKGVLFAAVNDIGRHWNASRCVAGLITPGKPPSAALEYCAPGVKQSDVMSIVKLITTMQTLCISHGGAISISNARASADLAPLAEVVSALGIDSVLAVALVDGDENTGVLILEQCGNQRQWLQTDQVVLRTIADQMALAVNNAKLRSLVKTLAVTDEKSGLLKRSSYLDVLLSEVKRSMQQKTPLSVMLMDFGKASAMVREMGEAAVESFIQQAGQTISSHIRQNDVPVRYDLTEIALVLSDTNEKNAFLVVDKMRKLLETAHPHAKIPFTMTVGIAEAVLEPAYDPADIVTEVINRAEAALDKAKADGGNIARSVNPVLAAPAS